MAYMRIPDLAARPSRMLAVGIASTVLRSGRFGNCANWQLSLHPYGSGTCHCIYGSGTASVRQWHLSLHPYSSGTASVRQWHLLQYGSGNCYCISTAVAGLRCT